MWRAAGIRSQTFILAIHTSLVTTSKLWFLNTIWMLMPPTICNLQPKLSPQLQDYISNYSLNSSIWRSKRCLTFNMSTTELQSFNPANLSFRGAFFNKWQLHPSSCSSHKALKSSLAPFSHTPTSNSSTNPYRI